MCKKPTNKVCFIASSIFTLRPSSNMWLQLIFVHKINGNKIAILASSDHLFVCKRLQAACGECNWKIFAVNWKFFAQEQECRNNHCEWNKTKKMIWKKSKHIRLRCLSLCTCIGAYVPTAGFSLFSCARCSMQAHDKFDALHCRQTAVFACELQKMCKNQFTKWAAETIINRSNDLKGMLFFSLQNWLFIGCNMCGGKT